MVYFKENYNFPRFQRGSNIFSRGGGGVLFLGGGGVQLLIPYWIPYITCVFPGALWLAHLPLVLEVPGSIPARGEENSESEHAFSSVIYRDDTR